MPKMLIKNLFIKSNSFHRGLYPASSIQAYNANNLFNIKNYSTSLIEDKRKLSWPHHLNALHSNNLQNVNIQGVVSVVNILRYKSDSSAIPKVNAAVEETSKKEAEVPLTTAEKLKKAVKEYGSTVIVFHVGISLISLGTCYLVVTSGLDVTKIFNALGLSEWVVKSQIASSAGTFAVAYAIHKVFAPVRIGITLTSVPFIVRYLRKIGFLKK